MEEHRRTLTYRKLRFHQLDKSKWYLRDPVTLDPVYLRKVRNRWYFSEVDRPVILNSYYNKFSDAIKAYRQTVDDYSGLIFTRDPGDQLPEQYWSLNGLYLISRVRPIYYPPGSAFISTMSYRDFHEYIPFTAKIRNHPHNTLSRLLPAYVVYHQTRNIRMFAFETYNEAMNFSMAHYKSSFQLPLTPTTYRLIRNMISPFKPLPLLN